MNPTLVRQHPWKYCFGALHLPPDEMISWDVEANWFCINSHAIWYYYVGKEHFGISFKIWYSCQYKVVINGSPLLMRHHNHSTTGILHATLILLKEVVGSLFVTQFELPLSFITMSTPDKPIV